MSRFLLPLLFVALIVEIVIIAPKNLGVDGEPDLEPQPLRSPIEYELREIHSVGAGEGPKEWELWAAKAVRSKGAPDLQIEKVKTKFFGEDRMEFTVTGESGRVNEKDRNLKVAGDVITRSSNGYRFETDAITYISSERRLYSADPVEMFGPRGGKDFRLDGQNMSANLKSGLISMVDGVRAKKRMKEDKTVNIESKSAEFSGRTNMARFLGDVVIDVETVRVTGPEAEFKFAEDGEEIEAIVVKGGVRVSDYDKWATSERVSFDFKQNRFEFSGGRPRLVQNNDELRGERIVFLDGGKTVRVFNAKAKVEKERVEADN